MSGMTTRALVLAGGGVTGIGWELGVMLGLREEGVGVVGWDLIVATSAGSIVGAALGEPGHLDTLRDAFTRSDGSRLRELMGRLDPAVPARIESLWFAPSSATDGPDRATRAAIGRLASIDDPELAAEYGASIERLVSWSDWPAALKITAVDVADGSPLLFEAGSGVPLAAAAAASCAVPGVFPPVAIGGRRYMDGGVRSASNADLAAGHDLVVVVAPNRPDSPWVQRLELEAARLRAGGTRVVEILLDETSTAAFSSGTMDEESARAAMIAGLAVGRREGKAHAADLAVHAI